MSKREKIIVGLTILTAVYGAFNFLFLSSEAVMPPPRTDKGELNRFIAEVTAGLQNKALSNSETLLDRATTVWPDPFVAEISRLSEKPRVSKRTPESEQIQVSPMIYSGYLMIGDRFLAIINGAEYEIGDELEGGEYVVHGITPRKITLQGKNKQNITLHLEEEGTSSG